MTKGELIQMLEHYDDDMIVRFSYDYDDRVHTQMAIEVSNVSTDYSRYSSYHGEHVIDNGDREVDDDNECIVLK